MPSPRKSTKSLYVGLDPGLSGAYGVLSAEGSVVAWGNLPVTTVIKQGSPGKAAVIRQLDGRALASLLMALPGRIRACAVERIVPLPVLSKTAALSLGDSGAVCRTASQWAKAEIIYQPTAATWKKTMSICRPPVAKMADSPDNKTLAKARARALFPDLPAKIRHDAMEALLLAEYARQSSLAGKQN